MNLRGRDIYFVGALLVLLAAMVYFICNGAARITSLKADVTKLATLTEQLGKETDMRIQQMATKVRDLNTTITTRAKIGDDLAKCLSRLEDDVMNIERSLDKHGLPVEKLSRGRSHKRSSSSDDSDESESESSSSEDERSKKKSKGKKPKSKPRSRK